MSLVNQVLRDLQRRQVYPVTTGLQSQIRPVVEGHNRITSGLLVLGVILLGAISAIYFLPHAEAPVHIEPVVQPPLTVHNTLPVNDIGFWGAKLSSVRLSGSEAHSRLVLEFSKPIQLLEKVLFAEHKMTVLLPDLIAPIIPLPQPAAGIFLFKSLNLVQIDNLWRFQVDFSTNVRVETLKLEADALHGERWVFDIYPVKIQVEKKEQFIPTLDAPVERMQKEIKPKPIESVTKNLRTQSPGEIAENFYQRGVLASKEQRKHDAVKFWQQALRLQPEHILARKELILALITANRSLANGLYAEGLALYDPLDLRKWYARALLPVAGAVEAAAILSGQEVSVAEDTEYVALQAGLWQQAGDYTRSRQAYLDLLQEFPTKGLYVFGLAVAHDQLAEQEKAIESYQKALNSDLSVDLKSYSNKRMAALAQTRGAGH